MKLIELFEDTITVHGWWISPKGEVYEVDSAEGHKQFIINNIEQFPNDENLKFNEIYDRGFYNGWVRLGTYVHGKRKNVSVEGKQSSLKRVYDEILDIAVDFNRVEVNVLSETMKKSGNAFTFGSIDFELFELPRDMEDLEKYLKGQLH